MPYLVQTFRCRRAYPYKYDLLDQATGTTTALLLPTALHRPRTHPARPCPPSPAHQAAASPDVGCCLLPGPATRCPTSLALENATARSCIIALTAMAGSTSCYWLSWSNRVVTLSHGHKANDEQQHLVRQNKLEFKPERISRLRHRGDRLQGVEFANAAALEAEALFFNTGRRHAAT